MKYQFNTYKQIRIFSIILLLSAIIVIIIPVYYYGDKNIEARNKPLINDDILKIAKFFNVGGFIGAKIYIEHIIKVNKNGVYLLVNNEYKPVVGNLIAWDKKLEHKNISRIKYNNDNIYGTYRKLGPYGFVFIGRSIQTDIRQRYLLLTVGALLGIVIILFIAGYHIYQKRFFKQIKIINNTAYDIIKTGDLSKRIIKTHFYEFSELIDNLNDMLSQIENINNGIKYLSNTIAHEIKTPLTRLRINIEENKPKDLLIKEIDLINNIFETLLTISRIKTKTSHHNNEIEISLCQITKELISFYDVMLEEKQQHLHLNFQQDIKIVVNKTLMFQAFINLLDNAIKYTPHNGHINITIYHDEKFIYWIITDQSGGVPDEELQNLTTLFFRSTKHISIYGNGLGLTLVNAIVTSHNGTLIFENSTEKIIGLKVTIKIPLENSLIL